MIALIGLTIAGVVGLLGLNSLLSGGEITTHDLNRNNDDLI